MKKHTPKHLNDAGKAFWKKVLSEYQFENEHDFKRLALCCECLDNIAVARKEIAEKGSFYTDRFKQPKPHPGYALIKDNMIVFTRILRELSLDIEPPADAQRPPKLY
jgi:P27 family predicted phage terminase small subunit